MKKHISKITFLAAAILFVLSLPLSAYLLRSNNVKAQELQQNVVELDKSSDGDLEVLEPAIDELAEYSLNHMNADVSVTLETRYVNYIDDLIDEQEKSASAYRSKVYNNAQAKCANLPVTGTAKIDCVQSYISSQPGVEPLELPPVDLFFYEFASPTWSLDPAGISTLISVVMGVVLLVVWITDYGIPMVIRGIKDDPLE